MKPPKNLIQYHWAPMEAFFNFLKDGNEGALIKKLYEIENHCRESINDNPDNSDKVMWFRFFKGDTLATTIGDIMNDLHSPNRNYIMEKMKICYETAEIEVYYS